LLKGKGWIEAGKLKAGAKIAARASDKSATLERIEKKPGKRAVYNFEVEGTHSYFVGDRQNPKVSEALWVHNYTLYGANLEALASNVNKAFSIGGQGRRTAAAIVATDGQNTFNIVASSSKYLTRAQQAVAQGSGAIYAKGLGHAEVTAIRYAQARGWTVVEVAASRPICPDCFAVVKRAGATAVSPLR
jgi:hypothetical protein